MDKSIGNWLRELAGFSQPRSHSIAQQSDIAALQQVEDELQKSSIWQLGELGGV